MAADIEQVKADVAVIDAERVESVARELITRAVRPRNVDLVILRQAARQQGALNTGRGIEIALHSRMRCRERIIGALE